MKFLVSNDFKTVGNIILSYNTYSKVTKFTHRKFIEVEIMPEKSEG